MMTQAHFGLVLMPVLCLLLLVAGHPLTALYPAVGFVIDLVIVIRTRRAQRDPDVSV
jgi:hypothetical protein